MITKLVDGVRIEMSPEEEAAFEASRTPTRAQQVKIADREYQAELQALRLEALDALVAKDLSQKLAAAKARKQSKIDAVP